MQLSLADLGIIQLSRGYSWRDAATLRGLLDRLA